MMRRDLESAIRKPANDAVVAGKYGAPLISDAKLLALHAALLRATGAAARGRDAAAAKIKFPAVYAALLADLAPHDRITADIPLNLTPFVHGSPLEAGPEIATGLALGLAQHRPGSLVIAFTRSNHLGMERFRRTLRVAAQQRAPVLYVLLPAPAASSSPASSSSFDWSARAILENVPCIPVDVQDAVALYRVAQETTQRARNLGGPSLIDCKQVQLVRGDSNSVTRMEAHLRRKGLLPAVLQRSSAKNTSPSTRPARMLADYDQTGYR